MSDLIDAAGITVDFASGGKTMVRAVAVFTRLLIPAKLLAKRDFASKVGPCRCFIFTAFDI